MQLWSHFLQSESPKMMTDYTNATRVKGAVELNTNCGWFTVFLVKLQPTSLIEIYNLWQTTLHTRIPNRYSILFFFSKKDRPQALYDCWRVIMAQWWRLESLAAIGLISYYLVSRMGASQFAWHSKILGMTGLCHQLSCLFLPEIDRNDANRFSSTQQLSLDLYFFLDN